MMSFTQDPKGDTSSIRVVLLVSLIIGSLTMLAALVGWFLGKTDAVLMAGCGAGLITGTGVAKSWQAQAEYHLSTPPTGGDAHI